MRTLWRAVGVVLTLAMVGLSCRMNWRFGYSLGVTEADAYTFGAVSVVADLFKATLPLFAVWAWEEKRRSAAAAGALLFVVLLGYSVASSVGFGAENRGGLASSRENLNAALSDALRDDTAARNRLAALPPHRPAATIAADIAALRKDRAWDLSKGCVDATAQTSRDLCKSIERLHAESGAGAEAAVLGQKVERLAHEVGRLREKGAGGEVDPQAAAIARLTAFDVPAVRTGLAVLLAVVVEAVSSLGLFVVLGHSLPSLAQRPQRARPEPAPPVRLVIDAEVMPDRAGTVVPAAADSATAIDGVALVSSWFRERLEPVTTGSVAVKLLEDDFNSWCRRQNADTLSSSEFRQVLARACAVVGLSIQRGRLAGARIVTMTALAAAE